MFERICYINSSYYEEKFKNKINICIQIIPLSLIYRWEYFSFNYSFILSSHWVKKLVYRCSAFFSYRALHFSIPFCQGVTLSLIAKVLSFSATYVAFSIANRFEDIFIEVHFTKIGPIKFEKWATADRLAFEHYLRQMMT